MIKRQHFCPDLAYRSVLPTDADSGGCYCRDEGDEPGLERRFVEFRYDGDRTLSGVWMKYGDIAELPWGEAERFEPGAFGSVGGLDLILNMQHSRLKPLARTGGGGLVIDDSDRELRVTATIPETSDGNDTITLVRGKVLRGFSIEFVPQEGGYRIEGVNGKTTITHTKAKLRGGAVVDRPAYLGSRIDKRQQEEPTMTEEQLAKMRAAIAEEVAKRGKDATPEALTAGIHGAHGRHASRHDYHRGGHSGANATCGRLEGA